MSIKHVEAGIKRWEDPEYRQQMLATHRTEEYREYSKLRQQKLWQDPDFKKRVGDVLKKVHECPEFKEKMRQKRVEALKNPVFRDKILTALAKANAARPTAERSEAAKKCWTEERRRKHAEAMKQRWADPAFKTNRKQCLHRFWLSDTGKMSRHTKLVRATCKSAAKIVCGKTGTDFENTAISELASALYDDPAISSSSSKQRVRAVEKALAEFNDKSAPFFSIVPKERQSEILAACLTLAYKSRNFAKDCVRDKEKKVRAGLLDSHAVTRSKLEKEFEAEIVAACGLTPSHLPAIGDIVFESQKLCIDVDGDVFHAVARHHNSASQPVAVSYHRNRVLATRSKGYRAIRLWGHEIEKRRHQCLNFVLGALNYGIRIGARSTVAKAVNLNEAKILVDAWHIQPLPLRTFLCAVVLEDRENARPLAVMTFGRHHRMGSSSGSVCLTRLAFAPATNVCGGSEKMLAFAKKNLLSRGTKIISWSHERLGEGAVYKRLGFVRTAELPPDYHYVGRAGEVSDKQSCQRKTLRKKLDVCGIAWDPKTSEETLAAHLSMSRCYDAGKVRWELAT